MLPLCKCCANCVCLVYTINGGDVQRKYVVNNVDKSSLWAPWQNGPYKNTQNITKHGVNKDATDKEINIFCVFRKLIIIESSISILT